jgi:hypothetical protein
VCRFEPVACDVMKKALPTIQIVHIILGLRCAYHPVLFIEVTARCRRFVPTQSIRFIKYSGHCISTSISQSPNRVSSLLHLFVPKMCVCVCVCPHFIVSIFRTTVVPIQILFAFIASGASSNSNINSSECVPLEYRPLPTFFIECKTV